MISKIKEKRFIKQTLTENGITLIALVVTIVVLLILASVSITVVFGDNGILQLAKEAGDKTNEAVKSDLQGIQNLTTDLDDIINPPVDISEIKGKVTENTKAVDKYGNKITIPAGFSIVPNETNDVKYTYDKDESGKSTGIPTVQDGIVIKDDIGNEFVWIPVFEETPIYTIYNGQNIGKLYGFEDRELYFSPDACHEPDILTVTDAIENDEEKGIEQLKKVIGITVTDSDKGETESEKILNKWKKQLQDEFDTLILSVNKYNGFYIGRYETGNLKDGEITTATVKKSETQISNTNWYYMYSSSKNISLKNTDSKVKSSVTSSMIWSCQWDAVMNWFLKDKDENTKKYVTDSTEMGNHKSQGTPELKPTGYYQVKNIYDMAGNAYEWTIGSDEQERRIFRGGCFGFSGSERASGFYGSRQPNLKGGEFGTRSTLIINI